MCAKVTTACTHVITTKADHDTNSNSKVIEGIAKQVHICNEDYLNELLAGGGAAAANVLKEGGNITTLRTKEKERFTKGMPIAYKIATRVLACDHNPGPGAAGRLPAYASGEHKFPPCLRPAISLRKLYYQPKGATGQSTPIADTIILDLEADAPAIHPFTVSQIFASVSVEADVGLLFKGTTKELHKWRPRWHAEPARVHQMNDDSSLQDLSSYAHDEYTWRSKLTPKTNLHVFGGKSKPAQELRRLDLKDTWQQLKEDANEQHIITAAKRDSERLNVRTFRPAYVPSTGSDMFSSTNELEVDKKTITSGKISFYSKTTQQPKGSKLLILFTLEGATAQIEPAGKWAKTWRVKADTDVSIQADPKPLIDAAHAPTQPKPKTIPKTRAKVSVQVIGWWTGQMHSRRTTWDFEVCVAPTYSVHMWKGAVKVQNDGAEKEQVVYAWGRAIPVYPARAGTKSHMCLPEDMADSGGTLDLTTAPPPADAADATRPRAWKGTATLMAFSDGCLPSPSVQVDLAWSRVSTPTITLDVHGELTFASVDEHAIVFFCVSVDGINLAKDVEHVLEGMPSNGGAAAQDTHVNDDATKSVNATQLQPGIPIQYHKKDRWRLYAHTAKQLFLLQIEGADERKLQVIRVSTPLSHEGTVTLQTVAAREGRMVPAQEDEKVPQYVIYQPSLGGLEHFDVQMCVEPRLTIDFQGEVKDKDKVVKKKTVELVISYREDGSTIYWRVWQVAPEGSNITKHSEPAHFAGGDFATLDARPALAELYHRQQAAIEDPLSKLDRVHIVQPDKTRINMAEYEGMTIELRAYKPGRLPSNMGETFEIPNTSIYPPKLSLINAKDGSNEGRLIGNTERGEYFYTFDGVHDPVPLSQTLLDEIQKEAQAHTKQLKWNTTTNKDWETITLLVVSRAVPNMHIKAVAHKKLINKQTNEIIGSVTSSITETMIKIEAICKTPTVEANNEPFDGNFTVKCLTVGATVVWKHIKVLSSEWLEVKKQEYAETHFTELMENEWIEAKKQEYAETHFTELMENTPIEENNLVQKGGNYWTRHMHACDHTGNWQDPPKIAGDTRGADDPCWPCCLCQNDPGAKLGYFIPHRQFISEGGFAVVAIAFKNGFQISRAVYFDCTPKKCAKPTIDIDYIKGCIAIKTHTEDAHLIWKYGYSDDTVEDPDETRICSYRHGNDSEVDFNGYVQPTQASDDEGQAMQTCNTGEAVRAAVAGGDNRSNELKGPATNQVKKQDQIIKLGKQTHVYFPEWAKVDSASADAARFGLSFEAARKVDNGEYKQREITIKAKAIKLYSLPSDTCSSLHKLMQCELPQVRQHMPPKQDSATSGTRVKGKCNKVLCANVSEQLNKDYGHLEFKCATPGITFHFIVSCDYGCAHTKCWEWRKNKTHDPKNKTHDPHTCKDEARARDRRFQPVCEHGKVFSIVSSPDETGWTRTPMSVFDTLVPGTTYVTVYTSCVPLSKDTVIPYLNSEAVTFQHVTYKAAVPSVYRRNLNKFAWFTKHMLQHERPLTFGMHAPIAADESLEDTEAAAYSVGTDGFQAIHDRELRFLKSKGTTEYPYYSFFEAIVNAAESGDGEANFQNRHSMTLEEQVLYVCYKCALDAVGFWSIVKLAIKFQDLANKSGSNSIALAELDEMLMKSEQGWGKSGTLLWARARNAWARNRKTTTGAHKAPGDHICFANAVIGHLKEEQLEELHIRGFYLRGKPDKLKRAFEEESKNNRWHASESIWVSSDWQCPADLIRAPSLFGPLLSSTRLNFYLISLSLTSLAHCL